jgi:hypothetical protein
MWLQMLIWVQPVSYHVATDANVDTASKYPSQPVISRYQCFATPDMTLKGYVNDGLDNSVYANLSICCPDKKAMLDTVHNFTFICMINLDFKYIIFIFLCF